MVITSPPKYHVALDYGFLLLVHTICADQQIHNQESQALRGIAEQANISPSTLQEMEKILGQDDTHITLKECAHNIPLGERNEVLKQILAIAYIDGYFSPLEREFVHTLTQLWGFREYHIEQMLEHAQGFSRWLPHTKAWDEEKDSLSIGARLLKGTESLLSRSLVTKLAELAPESIGNRIEQLKREILLSGPEYDNAIQKCAKIATEDFQYSKQALQKSSVALQQLGADLQQAIHLIQQKAKGPGKYQTATNVADHLEQTQKNLSVEILHDLETVSETLQAKQRALNHFSIAFMGRTKAGKSTLHAVITKEGWESIGIGKQRTTRYNRIYEWNNIRIIDTPGIGAPGGKTDEEVARSIIEEADVICYVVTNDSIQESEFEFLKVLKDKTKPLLILLNIQYNLRDPRRLEHFLKNPGRWFASEGKSGIGGHINRIHRYAQQHYANSYLTIVPVMLLAAQMAQEAEYEQYTNQLFKASRIQDFLDSIRISLIDYGAIRRSQTLLGSTVGSIDEPYQWITQQVNAYSSLATQLQSKRQSLRQKLQTAQQDYQEQLQQEIKEKFKAVVNQVPRFAEDHWESDKHQMQAGWKRLLERQAFEQQLKTAADNICQDFQQEVQEAIAEIGNELTIINKLQTGRFHFSEQDSNFFDKNFVRITGNVMLAAGVLLAFVFPPLGILSIVGTVTSFLAGWFKSREQKRREAVNNISTNLRQQLRDQQNKVLQQANESFQDSCQSVSNAVDKYFEELISGIDAITTQLQSAQRKLDNSANYLNRAYAKRIIDWLTDQVEPLTDITINQVIRKVHRKFGGNLQIETTTAIPLNKSEKEICKILQEQVSIQSPEV